MLRVEFTDGRIERMSEDEVRGLGELVGFGDIFLAGGYAVLLRGSTVIARVYAE